LPSGEEVAKMREDGAVAGFLDGTASI
jgi:hypothetical protein